MSAQADGATTTFVVTRNPIVDRDGDGSVGSTDVSVTVNGVASVIANVSASAGQVTLLNAPAAGATVLITYGY